MNTDSIRRRTTATAVVRSSAKTVSGGWCAKSFPDGRTSESITWRLKMTTAMWQPELPFTTVSPSVSPVREKDSQELPDSCSSTFERYVNSVHVGLSGRTSQERSQASGGEAYRQLLSEMDALGYGLAWRVLDAQFFGVAQRRERVFLVGSLGTMRCAEVLFERESLSWNHQSSRQKRQALTEEAQERVGEADHDSGCLNPGETQSRRVYPASGVYPTLSTREKSGQNQESVFTQFGDDVAGTLTSRYDSSPCVDRGANVVVDERDKVFLCQTAQTGSNGKLVKQDDVMNTLDRTNSTAVAALDFKVKPVAFLYNQGAKARSLGISEISPTLKTDHNPVVAFASNQHDEVRELEVAGALAAQPGIKQQTYICRADGQTNAMTSVNLAPTLTSHAKKDPPLIYPAEDEPVTLQIHGGKPGGGKGALIQRATLSTHNIQTPITGGREKRGLTVRRLTPRECERLQGFPDDYTDIPYRNKEHAPDGPRYKALGNSMAVPVMRWIGERIRTVEEAAETTD